MFVIDGYVRNIWLIGQDIDTETKYRDFLLQNHIRKDPQPVLTSDSTLDNQHDAKPSSCISHYLNVSVTYEEEAKIPCILATWRQEENPWWQMRYSFRNKEMGIEFLPGDVSRILFHELEK